MRLHVCGLNAVPDVVGSVRPHRVLSLVRADKPLAPPDGIDARDHLHLSFHDIVEPMDGHVMPETHHVETILDFARGWDLSRPMLVHCWAGISRSTAAAFVIACAFRPEVEEAWIATRLRRLSPSATPNKRIVALADELLGREGRMIAAVAAIGRGADAFEGTPFALSLEP